MSCFAHGPIRTPFSPSSASEGTRFTNKDFIDACNAEKLPIEPNTDMRADKFADIQGRFGVNLRRDRIEQNVGKIDVLTINGTKMLSLIQETYPVTISQGGTRTRTTITVKGF